MVVPMRETTIRLRTLVWDNFALVVAALVLLGAVGGYVTYETAVDPATRTEIREVSSWESTGEFTHRATVVNGTDAFAEGTVLHNRSVYFQEMTPRLNGSFEYGYTATGSGNLTTNVSLALVSRSVTETVNDNETVYWRVERSLGATGPRSLEPGESARIPFSVNVTADKQQAASIEKQVGDTPGSPRIHLLARVDIDGVRNGQPVDRTRRYRLPVRFETGVYRVADPGPQTASGKQTREVAVPVEYSPVRRLGGPFVSVVAICGLAGLIGGRWTGRLAVSETERDWLAYRRDREEFDDWITRGRMPAQAADRARVEVDSLSGLVDTAIDTGNRVIEDCRRDQFVVLSEDIAYVYEPPTLSDDGILRAGTAGSEPNVDSTESNAPGPGDYSETSGADDP